MSMHCDRAASRATSTHCVHLGLLGKQGTGIPPDGNTFCWHAIHDISLIRGDYQQLETFIKRLGTSREC